MTDKIMCWNCYMTGPAKDGLELKDEYFCKENERCFYCKEIEKAPKGTTRQEHVYDTLQEYVIESIN